MNRSYLRLVIGGILFGLAVYFVPFFILGALGFIIAFKLIGWLFWGSRHHHRYRHRHYAWAHMDHIRTMSDAEYDRFKQERFDCRRRWSNENKTENE